MEYNIRNDPVGVALSSCVDVCVRFSLDSCVFCR